jgi:hypothetical protein
MSALTHERRSPSAGMEPLPPKKKWRAIMIATLILVPAYWAFLAGIVAATDQGTSGPVAGPLIAFGLCVIPFVFMALAFLSEHPRPSSAVLRAMGLCLLVGIPVSALAADAVTGFVAGVGAGGVAALRADLAHSWRARALAVLVASLYTYVTLRLAGDLVLIVAPALPFTALGIVDHLSERREERRVATTT